MIAAEEQVIRDWLAGQLNPATDAPLSPSQRLSQPLPRRQVTAVVAYLIQALDEARAAPPPIALGCSISQRWHTSDAFGTYGSGPSWCHTHDLPADHGAAAAPTFDEPEGIRASLWQERIDAGGLGSKDPIYELGWNAGFGDAWRSDVIDARVAHAAAAS